MTAKQENPIKVLMKYCSNFIKMNNDEKSEGIKINYWMGIESQIKMLKIDNDTSIKVIFEEIFNKQTAILKTKHLLYCMISFLKPMNEVLFISKFFELLIVFAKEYDENRNYFNDYLIDLALTFFMSQSQCKLKEDCINTQMAFFTFVIDKDIEAFSFLFDAYDLKELFIQSMFICSSIVKLFIVYLNKVCSLNQFHRVLYLLSILKGIQINKEHMDTAKSFYNELLLMLIEIINRNSKQPKTSKSIIQLIYLTIQLTMPILHDIKAYDDFLLNAIELLVSSKTFHFELLQILNDIYSNEDLKTTDYLIMFIRLFPCVLYFFSDYSYDRKHIEFYLKAIEGVIPLYKAIIIKRLTVMQMISNTDNHKTQVQINFSISDSQSNVPDSILFTFPIEDGIKGLKQVSNLNLIDYLIKSCLSITNSSQSIQSISFNESQFEYILHSLNMVLAKPNQLSLNLIELISESLMIFISTVMELCLIAKLSLSSSVIQKTISILKQTSIEYQTEVIYPMIIQLMRGALIPNYDLFNSIVPLFFTYLCEFSRNDNIALLTSRLLVVLFNSKNLKGTEHKLFSLNMLVNVCVLANNSKLFQFYFNFVKELTNAPASRLFALSSINDYAMKYEGALQSPLIEYTSTMFQQVYDKGIDLMQFDSDALFATSTILSIFKKDKTENLSQLLKQYLLKDTFIGVINKITSMIEEGNVIENELGIKDDKEDNTQLDLITRVNKLIESINCLEYKHYALKKASSLPTCLFAVLKQVAALLSELLSYFLTEENESVSTSDQKQQSPMYLCIVKYFDFFWDKIVKCGNKCITTSHLVIINEILSNQINYHFFYVTHSNLIANKQIKDTQTDFSHLEEYTIKAINDKQHALIELIRKNPIRIFLFKDAFETILLREMKMIVLNYSNKQSTSNRVVIIKSIWDNKALIDSFSQSNDTNANIGNREGIDGSFFVIEFISLLMTKQYLLENQVFFAYCLYNKVFSTYFKQLPHLIDLEYIMLEYYSIVREKNCTQEYIGNYFEFILAFIKNSKAMQTFTLRLMSNSDIFSNLMVKGVKRQNDLYDIAYVLFENLIQVNSYQMESKETLTVILNNMQKNLNEYQRESIVSYANFIFGLVQLLSLKESSCEINLKLKALLLDQLLNSHLPSMIILLYKRINIDLSNKAQCSIAHLFNGLDILLKFKTSGLVTDLTNGLLDLEVIHFIDTFSPATETISNMFLNSLCSSYITELNRNHIPMAKFIMNYILFKSLSTNKEDRLSTIRDQTILLFDDKKVYDNPNESIQRQRISHMLLFSSLINPTVNKSIVNEYNDQYTITFRELGEILSNAIKVYLA